MSLGNLAGGIFQGGMTAMEQQRQEQLAARQNQLADLKIQEEQEKQDAEHILGTSLATVGQPGGQSSYQVGGVGQTTNSAAVANNLSSQKTVNPDAGPWDANSTLDSDGNAVPAPTAQTDNGSVLTNQNPVSMSDAYKTAAQKMAQQGLGVHSMETYQKGMMQAGREAMQRAAIGDVQGLADWYTNWVPNNQSATVKKIQITDPQTGQPMIDPETNQPKSGFAINFYDKNSGKPTSQLNYNGLQDLLSHAALAINDEAAMKWLPTQDKLELQRQMALNNMYFKNSQLDNQIRKTDVSEARLSGGPGGAGSTGTGGRGGAGGAAGSVMVNGQPSFYGVNGAPKDAESLTKDIRESIGANKDGQAAPGALDSNDVAQAAQANLEPMLQANVGNPNVTYGEMKNVAIGMAKRHLGQVWGGEQEVDDNTKQPTANALMLQAAYKPYPAITPNGDFVQKVRNSAGKIYDLGSSPINPLTGDGAITPQVKAAQEAQLYMNTQDPKQKEMLRNKFKFGTNGPAAPSPQTEAPTTAASAPSQFTPDQLASAAKLNVKPLTPMSDRIASVGRGIKSAYSTVMDNSTKNIISKLHATGQVEQGDAIALVSALRQNPALQKTLTADELNAIQVSANQKI